MKFLDADAQSRAFVAASIPIFLFGLCVFAEGLLQPINELAYDGIRWFKLLPLIVAGYMAIRANIPSVLNDHLDEFTRHVDLTARGHAGIAAMILLLLRNKSGNYKSKNNKKTT